MVLRILRRGVAAVWPVAAVLVLAAVATAPQAHARGGGPANIINSEGYQRALREERQQYQQAQPQPVAPVSASTHRHPRHHR